MFATHPLARALTIALAREDWAAVYTLGELITIPQGNRSIIDIYNQARECIAEQKRIDDLERGFPDRI
jgi:hypothetical protein